MRSPLLYEINTRCWLGELSQRYERPIHLGNVPEELFAEWQHLGFTHIWLMGVWRTGPRSRSQVLSDPRQLRRLAEILPDWQEADISGSPFAIADYTVSKTQGGAACLRQFRTNLNSHGIHLVLDFVPNHVGLDHSWIDAQPELFVQTLLETPETFPQRTSNGQRWLAHGKDPNFPAWCDTAQLDYRNPATRTAMTKTLRSVADLCDGVRCDMAMLLLNDVFAQTWKDFPVPYARLDSEFWPEAIQTVKQDYPDFLFLAEVYWDLEASLQSLGFDYTYDKRLYDYLVYRDFENVAQHLHRLTPDFIRASAHFLENHDESRIASILDLPEHRAAALLIMGLPGMTFLYEGQLTGATRHIPVQLARAPAEKMKQEVADFYAKLLPTIRQTSVGRGIPELLRTRAAWFDNSTAKNVIVLQWQLDPLEFDLVVVNLAPYRSQCYADITVAGLAEHNWQMEDLLGKEIYQRRGDDLSNQGLFLDLPEHAAQLFHFHPIH
jgi:glycosidase